MKKIFSILIALLLTLSAAVVSAEAPVNDYNQVFQVFDGYSDYYDSYSETPDTMNIAFTSNEDGMLAGFTITINGQYSEKECENLSGNVYAVKLNGNFSYWGTMFMVEDEGYDDYSYTYCFLSSYGTVFDLGWMPGRPTDIILNSNGTFSVRDRAYFLGTWSYTSDYIIAYGGRVDDATGDYCPSATLARIPRDNYTIGQIATLNVDLPVLTTLQDTQYGNTIAGGQDVILLTTDMKSRVYVSTIDGSIGGWVWIDPTDYPTKVAVNGEWQEEEVVFSNLFYAG